MSISEEIKNIDINSASGVGIFFFSLLGPGFLLVFLYQKELFINLDTLKLVILSLAISTPGVIVPFIISVITVSVLFHRGQVTKTQLGSGKEWFYRHGFNNAINMYALLFLSFMYSWPFSWFAWAFLGSIVLATIFEGWQLIKKALKPEKHVPIELP